MEPITGITLTSSQSTITFNNIPSTYSHLQVRAIGRTALGGSVLDNVVFQFNGDTENNYTVHYLNGNGSSAVAGADTPRNNTIFLRATGSSATSGNFGVAVCDVLDYANTNKFKTIRSLSGYDNNGSGELFFLSGLWRSTSAISSITIFENGNLANIVSGSQFALYGVK
jgi:hypothetical protein